MEFLKYAKYPWNGTFIMCSAQPVSASFSHRDLDAIFSGKIFLGDSDVIYTYYNIDRLYVIAEYFHRCIESNLGDIFKFIPIYKYDLYTRIIFLSLILKYKRREKLLRCNFINPLNKCRKRESETFFFYRAGEMHLTRHKGKLCPTRDSVGF